MNTLAEFLEEMKKKFGTLSKEQTKFLEDFFINNKDIHKEANKFFMFNKDYTTKTQQLAESKKEQERIVQQLVDARKAELETTLKAEYTKKVQAVESLQAQLQQAWQSNNANTGRTVQTLLGLLQSAETEKQNFVREMNKYSEGAAVLQQAGVNPHQSYLQQAQQAGIQFNQQGQFGQAPQFGFGGYQGYQDYYQQQQGQPNQFNGWQQPNQAFQQPFGGQFQSPFQQQNGQNGAHKPLTIEQILAEVEKKYDPVQQYLAEQPYDLQMIATEHQQLTGQPLNSKELLAKMREQKGAKSLEDTWLESYNINQLRQEAAQKAENERIEKLVADRLAQERAQQTYPSEKQTNIEGMAAMFQNPEEGGEQGKSANETGDPSKSYLNDFVGEINKVRENRVGT